MSRSLLVSFLSLVMSAAVLPACDSGDYEALGVSAEDLDRMSAEELDALDAELDDLANPLPPPTHDDGGDEWQEPPLLPNVGMRPRPTHFDPPPLLPNVGMRPRPTHAADLDDVRPAPVEPEGCDTHGDDSSTLAIR
jgi:hypothetical protein